MSLTISLTALEVEQRLAALGIVCPFTPEEKAAFATTPVVMNRPERTFAFPTPTANQPLTLHNIKACVGTDPRHQPCFFDHPWYQNEVFMSTRCIPGWHVLTMEPLVGSVQQPLDYLRRSEHSGLELPQAVELILMLFLHYAVSREQLMTKKHSWCSDVASLGRHVTVGAFGRNGVFLSGHPPNFSSQGLGIFAKVLTP